MFKKLSCHLSFLYEAQRLVAAQHDENGMDMDLDLDKTRLGGGLRIRTMGESGESEMGTSERIVNEVGCVLVPIYLQESQRS